MVLAGFWGEKLIGNVIMLCQDGYGNKNENENRKRNN